MKTQMLLIAACMCLLASASSADVWYVNDDAPVGGSGLAWESAMQTIESAVAAADVYDEIWVAQGNYSISDYVRGCTLKVGQKLYGGFVGNELDRMSRAAEFYATVTCTTGFMKAESASRIDGFNIVDTGYPDTVNVIGNEVTIANCAFMAGVVRLIEVYGAQIENCAFNDQPNGGLFVDFSDASVTRCTFSKSGCSIVESTNRCEGCTFDASPASVTDCNEAGFNRCSFWGSTSGGHPAVQISGGGNYSFDMCYFGGNWMGGYGAAIASWASALVTVKNTTFVENYAYDNGGAIALFNWSLGTQLLQLVVENCDFIGNQAPNGGAIWIMDCIASVKNCRFIGNSAEPSPIGSNYSLFAGGALCGTSSAFTLANCLFKENTAVDTGGAIVLEASSEASMVNCTLWGNTANKGGVIQATQGSLAQLKNCIVAESTPAAFGTTGITARVEATYSAIEGGAPGVGNVAGGPLFNDPENGDFQLLWGSPCIDTGTADGAPEADLDGTPRPQLAGIDMGAFEFVITDEDEDGMDDNWELYYDLNPADPNDADEDADGDGVTNAQEAAIRNNPQDPDDCRDTYYVATAGSDTDGDGSETNPWATIGKAMAYAGGFSAYKDVTINVGGGKYVEPVTFHPNITLAGAGAAETKIEYFDISEDEHFVVVGAEGAKLKDCTVRVSGQYSASFSLLKLDEVSMEIEGVTFDGDDNLYSLGALVSGTGSSETVIDGCTFRRLYFGVQAVNTAANVTNTTFSGIRGDAIFVRLPDVKKNGEAVCTPLLGDATYADTTGNNMFRNVMGNFVLNMNNVTTKAENNDWGVYTDAGVAAKMAGPVDYKPFIGEQADDGDNGGCFATADKALPMRASRSGADTLMMIGIAVCLAAGSRRKKQ